MCYISPMLTGCRCFIVAKVGRGSRIGRGLPAVVVALLLLFLMSCRDAKLPATLAATLPGVADETGMAMGLFNRTKNHSDEAGPLYRGNFGVAPDAALDEWVVVSYNLRNGEAITETIAAFQSVSYTHLDVYKRQAGCQPMGVAPAGAIPIDKDN